MKQMLSGLMIVACVGCGLRPHPQVEPTNGDHVTTEYLIAFQAEALQAFIDNAIDQETLLDITRYNSAMISLNGHTPKDKWIEVARKEWRRVRTRIEANRRLKVWVGQIDAMVQ